jgi:hypothetical protein
MDGGYSEVRNYSREEVLFETNFFEHSSMVNVKNAAAFSD